MNEGQKLPFDIKIELVTNTIRKLKVKILDNRNLIIDNADSLFNKVYFLRPTYTDGDKKSRVIIEVILYVWSARIDEAIIELYSEVIMQSAAKIDEEKDLWNLLYFFVETIDKYIIENNVVDIKGNLLKMPHFVHSKYQFAGLIA